MDIQRDSHRQHFIVLDGMRGIAAIIVVCLHAHQILVDSSPFLHAHLAVDFFFCLSGFVVAHAYGARLAGGMKFGEFFAMRLIRLYPMILAGTLLGGFIYVMGDPAGFKFAMIAATLLLLPAGLLIGQQAYPPNNPIWSLFFEIGANVFYALSPPIGVRTFGALAVCSTTALLITSVGYGGLEDIGFGSWISFALGFVRATCPFVLGVGICRLVLTERLAGRPAWVGITFLMTVLLMPSLSSGWYDALAVVLAFPLVVALATRSRLSHGTWTLILLGRISYPLYLIHQPVLRVLKHSFLYQIYVAHSSMLATFTAVMIALALSFIVAVTFDEPMRRFLTRLWRTRADRSSYRMRTFDISPESATSNPSISTSDC